MPGLTSTVVRRRFARSALVSFMKRFMPRWVSCRGLRPPLRLTPSEGRSSCSGQAGPGGRQPCAISSADDQSKGLGRQPANQPARMLG